jgi:uncharacterized protein with PIN domain/sulfur carrier protein ThiS
MPVPSHAHIRFYAELNDFLSPERQATDIPIEFWTPPNVKDLIESLGVPHTEVDLILVNGTSVDFSHPVQHGDRVSVYPVFEALDITPVLRVRPQPLRRTAFVCDLHLGRLAAYLRMLGFDTLYRNDFGDEELARISRFEHRILLTRDVGLLKRSEVTHGYFVRNTRVAEQALEVLRRFDLFRSVAPHTRCLRCNGPLQAVAKEEVAAQNGSNLRRIPAMPRLWPDLLERLALRAHAPVHQRVRLLRRLDFRE